MADALELRALWEAWQAEIRVPGSYCTDAYHALAEAVFESLPGLLDELAEASKRPAKIIINLGLDPHYPCPDWDKRKSSVTDERGEKVGFVDSNDGMRVVVFVDGDAQTAQSSSERSARVDV